MFHIHVNAVIEYNYTTFNSFSFFQMTYIHPLYVHSSTPLLPYPNENTPYLINAFIGTHVTRRSVCKLTYR
jgi:hypothetical protein